ncbi:HlyD family type I secretion periplasmic adaptor subunit [Sulfitobacter sp. M57]|uniref:HlyD family type I secretion periplasmic adaptor subunit n=1 Tax=unclassified Sulfitobacter TaxID=196795 RepID=UPI0023E1EDF2|nr:MULTISPECIES: HlyD family type I secretion periplasmic adaptor subunit [unclassified Sulfitobacter]MDF3414712.1 HlyD family type I secretion periplasmic adaptor subunit [Sulfitobacter sp. KE5]MDF3422193.1 HlyD family type I secretion periplasmic adaptor subunit [Sulfitobacter sp. KE43]MDF3433258.1 HlyD family type I secretion periplasmic adaptor subunit [Sulfitobacter sp. KE42]MDF3458898.1 HlyD family type I secretion periplasmic adaptor subunit [Sulfitobacter sp. S74]MDF3462797.1 HlyD fami
MSKDELPGLSARRPVLTGMVTIGVLLAGLFYWAMSATITGAVIARGTIEVERHRQIVQHPSGGVAAAVHVQDGQLVTQGDIMVVLDTRRQQRELAFAQAQLFEHVARQNRLRSEQAGHQTIVFDPWLLAQGLDDPALMALLEGQRALFQASLRTIAIERTKLENRKQQIAAQLTGIAAQKQAVLRQLDLIAQELTTQRALRTRKLTSAGSVIALERQEANLNGTLGEVTANQAAARQRLVETDLELGRLVLRHLEKGAATARDLDAPVRQYRRDIRALADEIAQARIRAPVSGVVYGLTLHSAQAVLRPAEPLLYLIPQDRPLIVAMQVAPQQIDQVRLGQHVKLRLSALDQRLTPEVQGRISRLSADAIIDEGGGPTFYRAEVVLPAAALEQLPKGVRLLPGMPVEAFIRTGERSPMAYMIKPVADYFARALRES